MLESPCQTKIKRNSLQPFHQNTPRRKIRERREEECIRVVEYETTEEFVEIYLVAEWSEEKEVKNGRETKKCGKKEKENEEYMRRTLDNTIFCSSKFFWKARDRMEFNEEIGRYKFIATYRMPSSSLASSLVFSVDSMAKYTQREWQKDGMCAIFSVRVSTIPLIPKELVIHSDLLLSRLSFCSLIDAGTIGEHWIIDGDKKNAVPFDPDPTIKASFFYDKGTLQIFFNTTESIVTDSGKRSWLVRNRITVHMADVNRLSFDQSSDPSISRFSLVLHLNSSPTIEARLKYENGSWGTFAQRTSFNRGRYQGEIAHPLALAESNVIVLQFDTGGISRNIDSRSSIDQLQFDLCYFMSRSARKSIEFSSFVYRELIEGRVRKGEGMEMEDVKPYPIEEDIDWNVLKMIKATVRCIQETRWTELKADEQEFLLRFILEGILQRGMAIRCQLLIDRANWTDFVLDVMKAFVANEKICLLTLDSLLHRLSDDWSGLSVKDLFLKEFSRLRMMEEEKKFANSGGRKKDYVQILKVVVGMTRVVCFGFETVISNRVLRKYNQRGNRVIRVVFRAEDGGYSRPRKIEDDIVADRMRSVLIENGVFVGGRLYRFLGSSNSQLRDYGMYFIHESDDLNVASARAELGRFNKLPSYSVALIRLGHCFTHTEHTYLLSSSDVALTHEITGGRKSFIFSDGVGCMSAQLADKLHQLRQMRGTMAAVQIRYRGHKGMLVKNPLIDDVNELLDMMGRRNERKEMMIRPSQIKFESEENDEDNLEIVRSSFPSPVYLNLPMINILDQVSQLQSVDSHYRITARMQHLLHMQLQRVVDSLFKEEVATSVLQNLNCPLSLDMLGKGSLIQSTTEPFFRSLLRAHAIFVIKNRLSRYKIRIPSNLGRTMLGVMDETGLLQSGQVFISYSSSLYHRRSTGEIESVVHVGLTLITKNPCISAGDVRMFNAVDIPALHHLTDVVVFPQHGPRPHPDEMAGSDLDGDEYTVVWDSELFLERNEEASEYPSGGMGERWKIWKGEEDEIDEDKMAEVYIDFCANYNVGQLSNNYLAASDAYGIDSKVAQSLADKIPMAMDYLKQGIAPDKMTEEESEDPDDVSRVIPAEKCTRKPNFLQVNHEPAYRSKGIMGRLYEEIQRYDEAISECEPTMEKILLDEHLIVNGWEEYERKVKEEMEEYNGVITSLLHRFGVESESELLSGCMLQIRHRVSEKRHDDTTQQVINVRLREEIERAKLRFYEDMTELNCPLNPNEESLEIRKKASAAYIVAYRSYNAAVESGSPFRPLISFPWLFVDVLNEIKAASLLSQHQISTDDFSKEPIAKELTRFVDEYCREHEEEVVEFRIRWMEGNTVIGRAMREIEGLINLSFVLCKWAKSIGGIGGRSKLREEHLISLFILYGFGEWWDGKGKSRKLMHRPTGDIQPHTQRGSHLLHFLNYLSSHHFRSLSSLSFGDLHNGFMCRKEWKPIAESSLTSFIRILISHKMDFGCVENEQMKTSIARVMELPDAVINSNLAEVRNKLIELSGCRDVMVRPAGTNKVLVSGLGVPRSLKKLDELIVPEAPPRSRANLKGEWTVNHTWNLIKKNE